MASSPASSYDCSFKVLLIGDSAVGKSSLLVSFVSAAHIDEDIAPTIGACALAPPFVPCPDGSRRCVSASLPIPIGEHDSNMFCTIVLERGTGRLLLGRLLLIGIS